MDVIHPGDRERSQARYVEAIRTGESLRLEHRIRGMDGNYRWFLVQARPSFNDAGQAVAWFGAATDIHEQRMALENASRSLAEKEALLKEVHHRVRNNLQIVMGLLNFHARHITDRNALSVLDLAQNRIQSIASIHEILYRSESFAAVQLAPYARRLVSNVIRLYGIEDRLEAGVLGANPSLELERAVPFGLLLNELISNACKHAFPHGERGKLTITLREANEQIVLQVADTGVGLPSGFDYNSASSVGVNLVRSLTRQLKGSVTFTSDEGTTVEVHLPTRLDPAVEELE